jgi:hypothetical protein
MSSRMTIFREILSRYDMHSGLANGGTREDMDRGLSMFDREQALGLLRKYTDLTEAELKHYEWRGVGKTRDLSAAHPVVGAGSAAAHAAMLRMALVLGLSKHIEELELEEGN